MIRLIAIDIRVCRPYRHLSIQGVNVVGEHSVNDAPTGPACWPAGLSSPMSRESAEQLSKLFKAVADPARLQILALIGAAPEREVCTCDLTDALGLSQPTVSHHLKILLSADLVHRDQRGTWAWFRLNPTAMAQLAAALNAAVDSEPTNVS
jgi:ArsR family transcriptional regulator, arsenate/arsenite/antimonite-responsive transcriptional repressor